MLVPSKDDEYFPYDVTMFWEFFRWERYKLGHIYLQCFKNGKLYAGQSIQIIGRLREYRNGKGSNPHHTKAIKNHGWSNVNVMTIKCPWYMLDTIEIFLIDYYDLTNPHKGYNKTTGGRKNWHVSKETRAKTSVKIKMMWEQNPHRRIKYSVRMSGQDNPMKGNTGWNNHLFGKKGIAHPAFGNTWTKTIKDVAKTSGKNNGMYKNGHLISGENNGMFGKKGVDHPTFGKSWKKTSEQIVNISGENNGISKPVCVFGKMYPSASTASNALRAKHAPKSDYNFIAKWFGKKKHQPYTFHITKEFYKYATENNLENITRDFYDKWLLHV